MANPLNVIPLSDPPPLLQLTPPSLLRCSPPFHLPFDSRDGGPLAKRQMLVYDRQLSLELVRDYKVWLVYHASGQKEGMLTFRERGGGRVKCIRFTPSGTDRLQQAYKVCLRAAGAFPPSCLRIAEWLSPD